MEIKTRKRRKRRRWKKYEQEKKEFVQKLNIIGITNKDLLKEGSQQMNLFRMLEPVYTPEKLAGLGFLCEEDIKEKVNNFFTRNEIISYQLSYRKM